MSLHTFEVLSPGLGLTLQDQGRMGWRRFGVPRGGAMDDHAAGWANRLLDNPPAAPILELLWQGAKLAVLDDVWIALAGAEAGTRIPSWRAVHLKAGDMIAFPQLHSGVWTYIAVEGGFSARRILGSASTYPRGGLGTSFSAGARIDRVAPHPFHMAPGVAGRVIVWTERRDYDSPPPFRVWPGPQWQCFSESDRDKFFSEEWTVTSQSDRVGYRLSGLGLQGSATQIISEAVQVGSVQVPENGQPIITMRDGPTVGGYPKLGMVDPENLSWLAQCRPGQTVRFQLATA